MRQYAAMKMGLSHLLLLCLSLPWLVYAAPHAASPPAVDPALRSELEKAMQVSDSFIDRFEAEVWLMDMSNRLKKRLPNTKQRLSLLRHIHAEANRVQLAPELLLAVIHIESYFDAFAVSRVGAQGLMQIMPFWKAEIGRESDNLFDMPTNLRYGSTILRYYLDREKGHLRRALQRYNGALKDRTQKYANKVLRARHRHWYHQ